MADDATVLVGYATADGSTAGVAGRIADRIRDGGCAVDCLQVGPQVAPRGYDAVVLGSAVHGMAWLPPAVEILDRVPETVPTWFFSVGGLRPRGPITRRLASREVTRVERGFPPALRGRRHRLFAGVVRMAGSAWWARLLRRLAGGRDGDHRDWAAIDAWGREIAAQLARAPGGMRRPRG
jgi:menaquinone-dependent protoporphyrinogen oxidase